MTQTLITKLAQIKNSKVTQMLKISKFGLMNELYTIGDVELLHNNLEIISEYVKIKSALHKKFSYKLARLPV